MPKNVEVKAIVKDFYKIISIAKGLCNTDAIILNQEDTFFKTCGGRLKLRNFQDGSQSQLIFYDRPDTESPKVSDFSICHIENHKELLNVLKPALGLIGTVRKTRHLFLYEQARIHIDKVEGLGEFIELEVVLKPNQCIKEGEEIANFLMKKFEINQADLISVAYIDLLQKNNI